MRRFLPSDNALGCNCRNSPLLPDSGSSHKKRKLPVSASVRRSVHAVHTHKTKKRCTPISALPCWWAPHRLWSTSVSVRRHSYPLLWMIETLHANDEDRKHLPGNPFGSLSWSCARPHYALTLTVHLWFGDVPPVSADIKYNALPLDKSGGASIVLPPDPVSFLHAIKRHLLLPVL